MDHSTTETQHRRTTRFGLVLIGIFIVLMIVTRWMEPRYPAQRPAFYYPDPTPYVVETQRIEIFSGNKLCIGANVSC